MLPSQEGVPSQKVVPSAVVLRVVMTQPGELRLHVVVAPLEVEPLAVEQQVLRTRVKAKVQVLRAEVRAAEQQLLAVALVAARSQREVARRLAPMVAAQTDLLVAELLEPLVARKPVEPLGVRPAGLPHAPTPARALQLQE